MTQPKGYVDVRYLDTLADMVQHYKVRTYDHLRIQPGYHVLDVGCGPGTDTIPLAHLVGPTGQVVGVDYDADMIVEADRRAAEAGLSSLIQHVRADATALPFATDTFDACRSERLFQHLVDPRPALAEMIRVTRPDGWIVVLDTDWGTVSIDTAEPDIERRLERVRAERCLNNGYSGRQFYRLFKRNRLADVTVEPCPLILTDLALARWTGLMDRVEKEALDSGVITPEELNRWHTDTERADAQGVFITSGLMILAAGQKPEAGAG